MDGRQGGGLGGPRAAAWRGDPVLWYNALLIGAELARRGRGHARAGVDDARARSARFLRTFGRTARATWPTWWPGHEGPVARPNQLYAIGLPHALPPGQGPARPRRGPAHLLTPRTATLSLFTRTIRVDTPATCEPRRRLLPGHGLLYLMGITSTPIRLHGEEGKGRGPRGLTGSRRTWPGRAGTVSGCSTAIHPIVRAPSPGLSVAESADRELPGPRRPRFPAREPPL